jgi:hypothetical protein
MTDNEAHDTIVNFWNERGLKWTEHNRVKFTSGRCANLAIKNVVANGLSQSFIEPLEATSIMITCWTVIRFVEIFNRNNDWNNRSARILHSIMSQFLDNTKSFVGYHYQLSERTDTDYWNDYKNPAAIQEVNDIISDKLRGPMLEKSETALNKFNWASLLLGFDKPFNNTLTNISSEQIENYLHFCKQAEENYKFVTRYNPSNEFIINKIHSKSD